MWLYLENESFIFIEAVIFALLFFAFQLIMALKAKRVALKLIPVYAFALFSMLLLVIPFVITDNAKGNWGLLLVTLFNIGELAFIALFVGLAWICFAIIRAFKKTKRL